LQRRRFPPSAEQIAALTLTNQLVLFDSAAPGTTFTLPITGLTAGDQLVGIDTRPADNLLYGVAIDSGTGGAGSGVGRIYTINTGTGAASLASTLTADPADATAPNPFTSVAGEFFGVDFNPAVDRLRVVSDTGQNLPINVTSGLTQFDVAAAYAAADPNSGSPPSLVAAAYTNSVSGAATTSLLVLDSALSQLNTQAPANDGTLNTVAITSGSIFPDTAFDISGATNVGYVVVDGLTLATINLTSGVITDVGVINTLGSINGLAVIPGTFVPEPGAFALLLGGVAILGQWRRRKS